MRLDHTRRLASVAGLALALALAGGRASADPLGFSVNQDSHDVSVVDLTTRTTRGTVPTLMSGANDPGSVPTDVVVDPQSGRVYVSSKFRLLSFDGRLSVGPTPPAVFSVNARDKGSALALDAGNRRLFMSHGDMPGFASGIVGQYSITTPAQPGFVAEHLVPVAAGASTNLRFLVWENRYRRLYAVADDGVVYRTGQGNLVFGLVTTGVVNPGGILADPAGNVWISSRNPGNLIRITEAGVKTSFAVNSATPRGLAWQASTSSLLVAVDSLNAIRRFRPNLGTFDAANAMATAENPQDVALTPLNAIVSLNRRTNIGVGNMTVGGISQPVDTTGQRSIALAVLDVAKLTATPVSQSFCWNFLGDRRTRPFTIQNTRLDRAAMTLLPVAIAGSNPSNYALVGTNTCNGANLAWGATCSFDVQFTAQNGCVQPPPPFGGPGICYWPSEVVVTSTVATGSATTRIPVQGALAALPCPP